MKLLVINGPNLNFLGIREKSVYGTQDYDHLLQMIAKKGEETGCTIEVFQSNHEGAIIDRIQDSYFDGTEGIVINPAPLRITAMRSGMHWRALPFPRWRFIFLISRSGRNFVKFR